MTDVDDLYGLDPEDFIPARDALSRALKADGDAAAAAQVKALRKPTAGAWLLNRLARSRPDVVASVVDVGAQLHAAQETALAGQGGAALRELAPARRRVVDQAAAAAREVAEHAARPVTATTLDAVRAGVESAITDPRVAAAWTAGRLSVIDDSGGTGFTEVDSFVVPQREGQRSGGTPPRTGAPIPPRPEPDSGPQDAPALAGRPRRVDALAAKATAAHAVVEQARGEVERLREVSRQADAAARAARQALKEAERAAARADLAAATVEQALWEAGDRARGG